METILADISINGTVQQGQKLVLPSNSTVYSFILAVVSMFCKDATDTTVNSVKYFDPDFKEFVDIEKPFENVPILFQHRYAISIVYTKTPINLNSNSHDIESKLSNKTGGDNSFDNSHSILFYCPDPPEWRDGASVAYFKDKLYYLGGKDPESKEYTSRIDNSARPHDIEKRPSQIEGKTPNDEPRPKRAKKGKQGTVNDMYDMYQLNPSLLTDKDDSLVSHPDFRLGNIRAAAIECGILYNRNKKVCYGINDMIRKTVVCLMAQLFKHDNPLTYTAAQKLKPGMTKFPEQISAKIAAGVIKLIEMKPNSATKGSETGMKMPADQWIQLIYQEIEHALRNSPTRNTTKPLFKQINDEDYICKLKLDQQAVQSGWYENAMDIAFIRSNASSRAYADIKHFSLHKPVVEYCSQPQSSAVYRTITTSIYICTIISNFFFKCNYDPGSRG
ncbi:hypothetical protein WR25_22849 [Diploscapter pachys]|uniref:Uncharacterized protein n=1 Tax=Diploscapter pachys TaxID=2018661 RepID=A0A2A2LGT4_9BILA|nr:hypothetical protein WR25_22849 [Diploscapter pachys]